MTRQEIEKYLEYSGRYEFCRNDSTRSYYTGKNLSKNVNIVVSNDLLEVYAGFVNIGAPLDAISWSHKDVLNITGILTL